MGCSADHRLADLTSAQRAVTEAPWRAAQATAGAEPMTAPARTARGTPPAPLPRTQARAPTPIRRLAKRPYAERSWAGEGDTSRARLGSPGLDPFEQAVLFAIREASRRTGERLDER